MSDVLGDILKGRRGGDKPPEFVAIKQYLIQKYRVEPTLKLSGNNLIIGVPSAAIAGSLRMELHKLAKLCHTDRRLIIRIGE